ncbi:bifunctional DNA-binding transcriptional regulator/O6-methylguanine-DNA methyltransferase Ada [uncultured Roseobacter sp.]|uniref:bifunctional DNA-binding transcriptional regulator/O6-methylguanine-DNA methyltransferase Ada n=1 Tax=uncultured Roseobacter sp. TaxID=114847 RepID=UPI0026120241|nr:bifunctional DNA-binding transcriptional regulator/O6-methylguanine-DNA methyltransferase Ada [uncultured Roseobacter sp.]
MKHDPVPARNVARWQAVLARDASSLPPFFYAVTTTGIYCRPDCPSRRPHEKNVAFFDHAEEARAAGYRACKRCKPDETPRDAVMAEKITAACREIEEAEEEPGLEALATSCGLSVFHFHRLFKAQTGVTPKAYARAHRMQKVRQGLNGDAPSVTSAMYDAGFNSSSRFYETATQALGMSPSAYRNGGRNTRILFAVGECALGSVLVACSQKGVCAILLGDTPEKLLDDLQSMFPQAELIGGDAAFEALVARVVGFVDAPRIGLDLPLDIQGTAFQERVWQALRDIPAGQTASYREIAETIGAPSSFRAVAQACGANPLAVAIPCHRVVRSDGGLSGYRWGIARKQRLLSVEKAG